MHKNYYEILALDRRATLVQIQERFRDLVRERHPDRFQGTEKKQAEKEFQDITEAFNVLRDPQRRRLHDQALERPPERREDPLQLGRVYLNRGIKAYKLGNYIEAADYFDRASQSEPDNHQAWHHLARTCLEREHWLPRAQEAIDRACQLRPNYAPYVKLAARIFLKSGMTTQAKQYYNDLLGLGGSDATVRKALEQAAGPPGSTQAKFQHQTSGKGGLFGKIW